MEPRKRIVTLAFLVICLFPSPTLAQTLPDAPKPKPHSQKVFWIGTALLAASQTADAITTRQIQDRGGWENNPLLGRRPSNASAGS